MRGSNLQILPERIQNQTMDKVKDLTMTVRLYRQAIAESREASASEVAEIDRNWRYYWGQHYLRKVGNRWLPDTAGGERLRLQRDIIQLSIDALRPIMVKMSPFVLALATYPDAEAVIESARGEYRIPGLLNADVAAFLTEAQATEHQRRYEDVRIAEATLEVMIAGQCFETLIPVHRPGFGTIIEPKIYPRARIYLDPRGTRLTDFRDYKYVIFEDEMDAAEIYHCYGIREKEYVNEEKASENRVYDFTERGFFRSLTEFKRHGNDMLREQSYERRVYKVHTGYFNEYASELHAYHGNPKTSNYPFGRQLVMINEQKIVIDQPNPFDHGQYPVSCLQSMPIPFVGRALSEMGKLKDSQRGVNLLFNALIGTAMLSMNPKVLYEDGAFNPNDWQSGPGGFVRVSKGAISQKMMDWFQPAVADRGAYNLMKDTEYHAKEDVAGVTPSIQGKEPFAGSSGKLYESEQAASMTGPTFKIQNLDAGHHRRSELELELLQQYADWREPYYQLTHDMGQYHPMMGDAVHDLYFRVIYESRAELPHNPIARHNYFWNQYAEGVIDFEQYLLLVQPPMRPALREAARQGSLENYMPGVPREFRLELMAAQIAAQQQVTQGEQQVQQLGQGPPRRQLAGDANDFTSEGIAGSPNDRPL